MAAKKKGKLGGGGAPKEEQNLLYSAHQIWLAGLGALSRAQAGAPKQEDLTSTAMVRLSLALLTLGVWGLAGGVLAGHAPVILAGATCYLAGVLAVLGQYGRILLLARPLPAQRTVTLSTK